MNKVKIAGIRIGIGRGLFLACWLSVIYYFSSQPYAKQDLRPWLERNFPLDAVERWLSGISFSYARQVISIENLGAAGFVEFFVRKGAHFTEYFILGMLACFMLFTFRAGTKTAAAAAAAFCFLYAISDELHQSTTIYRIFKAEDVVLDTFGALCGIGAVVMIRSWKRRKSRAA